MHPVLQIAGQLDGNGGRGEMERPEAPKGVAQPVGGGQRRVATQVALTDQAVGLAGPPAHFVLGRAWPNAEAPSNIRPCLKKIGRFFSVRGS